MGGAQLSDISLVRHFTSPTKCAYSDKWTFFQSSLSLVRHFTSPTSHLSDTLNNEFHLSDTSIRAAHLSDVSFVRHYQSSSSYVQHGKLYHTYHNASIKRPGRLLNIFIFKGGGAFNRGAFIENIKIVNCYYTYSIVKK